MSNLTQKGNSKYLLQVLLNEDEKRELFRLSALTERPKSNLVRWLISSELTRREPK